MLSVMVIFVFIGVPLFFTSCNFSIGYCSVKNTLANVIKIDNNTVLSQVILTLSISNGNCTMFTSPNHWTVDQKIRVIVESNDYCRQPSTVEINTGIVGLVFLSLALFLTFIFCLAASCYSPSRPKLFTPQPPPTEPQLFIPQVPSPTTIDTTVTTTAITTAC